MVAQHARLLQLRDSDILKPVKMKWVVGGSVALILITVLGVFLVKQGTLTLPGVHQATKGWRYVGTFPDSAVNVTTLRLKDGRYVAYYSSGQPGTGRKKPNRAFSPDGLTWTPDPSWTCPDLCDRPDGIPSLPHRDHVALSDGRFRTYIKSANEGGVVSFISDDGLTWKKESGIRLKTDSSSEWEQGPGALVDWSALYLPDGKIRAYYQGQKKPKPGEDCGSCYVVLSAISNDDGLTFAREPGLRLDPREAGQVFSSYGGYGFSDAQVVAVDGGYRAFFGDYSGPIATAFSEDGLAFTFEGPLPLWGANPNVHTLPDGRLLVLAGQGQGPGSKMCPGGCPENYNLEHMLVSEPLPVTITPGQWDNGTSKATIEVKGTAGKQVTLKIIEGTGMFCKYDQGKQQNIWEPGCYFNPEKYTLEPASGTVPFTATLSRPIDHSKVNPTEHSILITGTVDDKDVAAVVRCIGRSKEFSGDPNCK